MNRRISVAIAAILGLSPSIAFSEVREIDVQSCVCNGGILEVSLPSGARADCTKGPYAIEVDPTHKWAEAIGQALHYADQTNLLPKIVLFCEEAEYLCLKHSLRLEQTIAAYSLPIEVELLDVATLLTKCGIEY